MTLLPRSLRSLALLACFTTLAACGGGGAEDASEPLPTSSDIRTTGRPMDVGIVGDGLFVLQQPGSGEITFSRLGRLDLDTSGRLIHEDGGWVMGQEASTDARPLALSPAPLEMPPRASRLAVVEGNLRAYEQALVADEPINPDKAISYNSATSFTAWNDDGSPLHLALFFRKIATDRWQVEPTVQGVLAPSGFLLDFSGSGAPVQQIWTLAAGSNGLSQPLVIRLSFTQYAMPFSTATQVDGYPAGRLRAVNVSTSGEMQLSYDNDQTIGAGRLQLARFTVADRLTRTGHSSWRCGGGCGTPLIGAPGSPLMGLTRSGTLNTAY